MSFKLHGIVAATHTPFNADGSVNLAVVEKQAEHLIRTGVSAAFINGTTGECSALTSEERLTLADRWAQVTKGTPLKLVVHVGTNSLHDAITFAAHAQKLGAHAISALAPSYFKPRNVSDLVTWSRDIAAAAPGTPFYFYDIPSMTSVHLSMPDFLEAAADHVPTLAGLKFTNPDLMSYQRCMRARGGRFDNPWGTDEYLLAALALGAQGCVGSTYNFAAPLYHRLWTAFNNHDLATARLEQYRSVELVQTLASQGYMGSAKALMSMIGIPVGPARQPNPNPTPDQLTHLRTTLEKIGYFDWSRP